MSAYTPPTFGSPIDIDLSKNEGKPGPASRYPDTEPLRSVLASRIGVGVDQVLVTAGGDDALFRCFLANAGRDIVTTTPSFEMIPRYASQVGAELIEVPWWDGDFPVDDLMGADADVAVVVSPNNPTGSIVDEPLLAKIASSFELVVLDAAYVEFADTDLTDVALDLGNVVVVRTLSKALGLAGLRVGYLLGPPGLIDRMSGFGNPYPVSSVSLDLAEEALASVTPDSDGNRLRRDRLSVLLADLGLAPLPSQANFVLASSAEPDWLVPGCAALGVAIRGFPDRPGLAGCVRITVPRDDAEMDRLASTLRTVLEPEALLFDLDGVLADVSKSYRRAIVATASSFGISVTTEDVDRAKAAGDANDDWEVTRRLCADAGVIIPYDEVVSVFETVYQGDDENPGLKSTETPLIGRETLARLAARYRLGVVTGRPRKDAREFLERFELSDLFHSVVTREDAPMKPDPATVHLALEQLGVTGAWMLGDTRDDLEAARAASVLPIGVSDGSLSPAAVVLRSTEEIEEILR